MVKGTLTVEERNRGGFRRWKVAWAVAMALWSAGFIAMALLSLDRSWPFVALCMGGFMLGVLSLSLFAMLVELNTCLAELTHATRRMAHAFLAQTPPAWSSQRDTPRPQVNLTEDEDTVVVPLAGVLPADAWQTIESAVLDHPESPVAIDLYECPPGYDTEVGPLLDRFVGLGPPGVLREVLLLSVTPEVAQAAVNFSEQRGWHWERWESLVRVFVGKPD